MLRTSCMVVYALLDKSLEQRLYDDGEIVRF